MYLNEDTDDEVTMLSLELNAIPSSLA